MISETLLLASIEASRGPSRHQAITDSSKLVGCSLDPFTDPTDPFLMLCPRCWTFGG